MSILSRLRRLQRDVQDNIRATNYGGCGYMAGYVCEALEALGIEAEVVTPGGAWWGDPPAIVRSNLGERKHCAAWDEWGLARSHLAVRFKLLGRVITWDRESWNFSGIRFGVASDGEVRVGSRYPCEYPFGDGLTWKETLRLCRPQTRWNTAFCRTQLPLMRELVQQHLTA